MNTHPLSGIRAAALALLAAASLSPSLANAGPPGHSFAAGGFHGGGAPAFRGGYGGHAGYVGRPSYGWHGGYGYGYGYRGYGWYGGYYGWRPYYGWGWWGWPVGAAFLATLPFYYSTIWWNGVPYYYANNGYYLWNDTAGGYVSVSPPQEVVSQAPAAAGSGVQAPASGQLFVYPRNGQSTEQTLRDRQECQDWAASQAGAGADNLRAQTACLEGRGYSVR